MNCTESARLMNAHADGELDIPTTLALDEHLEGCGACRRSYESLQAVRQALACHAATPRAPESLRRALEPAAAPGVLARIAARLRSPLVLAAPGLVALAMASWLLFFRAPAASEHPRIVFHISSSESAGSALRSLGNHLRAEPDARIVVVAHNNGVDFMLAGARDDSGRPFAEAIRQFHRQGVDFRICHNTLSRRGIADSSVIPEVRVVPSGIAEIGRLQRREGFVYMRL